MFRISNLLKLTGTIRPVEKSSNNTLKTSEFFWKKIQKSWIIGDRVGTRSFRHMSM